MSNYSTLLTALQDEAHEPADSGIFARHVQAALHHLRPLVLPWSHATATVDLVQDQREYERGVDIPGDILSFDSIYLLYSGTSGGLNIELMKLPSINEFRRLDVSTTSAVGIPNFYVFYDDKLFIWPQPGATNQQIQMDYHRDATLHEDTGVAFDASNVDTSFTNEFFRRGEELLRTRVLMTYAMTRSHSNEESTRAQLLYKEAYKSVMRERDMMSLEANQVKSYW